MTLREKIDIARAELGTTYTEIGAALYPDANRETQKNMISHLMAGRVQLTARHIQNLIKLFPKTNANYWIK